MKKEIPILFSTPMVQAILAGRKTMTRRIIKDKYQPVRVEAVNEINYLKPKGWPLLQSEEFKDRFCPYGKIGDVLYVRETWNLFSNVGDCGVGCEYGCQHGKYVFKASGTWDDEAKWKPSIHMPKAAARIWLEVTDVRVERLQDISEEDAKAEGVQRNCEGILSKCPACEDECKAKDEWFHYTRDLDDFPAFSAKESFESLWQSINGAASWNANSFVWVVSFKVLSTTGKP